MRSSDLELEIYSLDQDIISRIIRLVQSPQRIEGKPSSLLLILGSSLLLLGLVPIIGKGGHTESTILNKVHIETGSGGSPGLHILDHLVLAESTDRTEAIYFDSEVVVRERNDLFFVVVRVWNVE
jgi:hypothetical protein